MMVFKGGRTSELDADGKSWTCARREAAAVRKAERRGE